MADSLAEIFLKESMNLEGSVVEEYQGGCVVSERKAAYLRLTLDFPYEIRGDWR
jgi:hypothetical protein